ncbi:hypothetical protein ACFV6G_00515 [Streptomyces lavendulae]|uniref:hypothetical protein n=1 Tax=Streptomyces lavendulae TaxID=1914 RepID=UPI00367BDA8C
MSIISADLFSKCYFHEAWNELNELQRELDNVLSDVTSEDIAQGAISVARRLAQSECVCERLQGA